jgi:hypothetical protein
MSVNGFDPEQVTDPRPATNLTKIHVNIIITYVSLYFARIQYTFFVSLSNLHGQQNVNFFAFPYLFHGIMSFKVCLN